MIEGNIIEKRAEIFAERYMEGSFPGIKEKLGAEIASYIEQAFCAGFETGADNIIRSVKQHFEGLTTHTHAGYRGQ